LNIKKITCLIIFLAVFAKGFAQQVDTIIVVSPSMNAGIQNIVILPDDYDRYEALPVLYLLHGYGGNHRTWMQMHTGLPELATRYGIIIVCPDGKNSWYWDSPINPAIRYETYVAQELVSYMDSHYKTISDKKGRAITGASMGGHGGLWIGFRHPDIFGACGSIHGGVDIRPFPDNWEMKKALGPYDENHQRWDEHTVINLVDHIQSNPPSIIIDCGTADFFFEVNVQLHAKLLSRHILHDYVVRPGEHNSAYAHNAIEYQLLFFHLFFK
jgi:S-formylglutathione hydrolase FrmB